MSNEQYNELFIYMHSEFSVIKDSLAKKANAVDVQGLRDDVISLRRETSDVADQVVNLDSELSALSVVVERADAGIVSKLDENHETIVKQLDEIQNAVGEAFVEDKVRIDQHESWIEQLEATAGVKLKRARNN